MHACRSTLEDPTAACAARYHMASGSGVAAQKALDLLQDPALEGAFFTPEADWIRAGLKGPQAQDRLRSKYEALAEELSPAADVLSPVLTWDRYCADDGPLPDDLRGQACAGPALDPLFRRLEQIEADLAWVEDAAWPALEKDTLRGRLQEDKVHLQDEIGRAAQAELRKQRDALRLLVE